MIITGLNQNAIAELVHLSKISVFICVYLWLTYTAKDHLLALGPDIHLSKSWHVSFRFT